MIFLCAVSESDAKSIPIISGKLRSTLKNLKDYKVWLDVYAPDDIEIQDLVSIYGIDKELLTGHKYMSSVYGMKKELSLSTTNYSKILCFDNYIFFELSSYFLDEDSEINYNKSPMMYRAKAKFFIGDDFIISFHHSSFPINSRTSTILVMKKKYESFISDTLTIIMDSILDDYYDVISNIREAVTVIEDRVVDNYIDGAIPVIRYNKKKWIILDDLIEDQMNMFRPVRLAVMSWTNDTLKETMIGFYDDLYSLSNTLDRVKENITEVWNMYAVLSQDKMNDTMFKMNIGLGIFVPVSLLLGFFGLSIGPLPMSTWGVKGVEVLAFIILIYIIFIGGVIYYKIKKEDSEG